MKLFIFSLTVTLFLTQCSTTGEKTAAEMAREGQGGGHVKVHGHRGSRGTHPENSLPAFQEAAAAGANFLEMDLHLSSDNVPFVSHDSALDRNLCRDGRGKKIKKTLRLRSLTSDQIQQYRCGAVTNPKFPEQMAIPGTKIPRFEEVLSWVKTNSPSIELNIETKMDEPRAQDNPEPKLFSSLVIELLNKYKLLQQSVLQSFDFRTLEEAKKIDSSLRLSALVEHDKNFCDIAAKGGFPIVSPDYTLVTAERVKQCAQKNILVVPWTVNAEAEWKKLRGYGVEGIITDYPRKLVAFLKLNEKKE